MNQIKASEGTITPDAIWFDSCPPYTHNGVQSGTVSTGFHYGLRMPSVQFLL